MDAFLVIAIVIGVGAVVGRAGWLGDNARTVLNRMTFHIGVPALLIFNLSQARFDDIFSASLLTSATAALSTFVLCFVIFAVLRRRTRGDSTVASWTASYVNAGNFGIPLSAYLFGDTTAIAAILLFQAAVMAPLGFAILNSATHPPATPWRQVVALARNPVLAASVVGLVLASTGIGLPGALFRPVELLANLAIPTALLAFGLSLSSRSVHTPYNRGDLLIAVASKTILMPAVAYVVGHWAVHLDTDQLLLVTTLAALPSAQNINTYAAVFQRNESLAGHATLASTVVSAPIITAIVVVTGA